MLLSTINRWWVEKKKKQHNTTKNIKYKSISHCPRLHTLLSTKLKPYFYQKYEHNAEKPNSTVIEDNLCAHLTVNLSSQEEMTSRYKHNLFV